VGGSSRDEFYVQDVNRSKPIIPAIQGIDGKFAGQTIGDTLYVTTNWKAPKWRLVAVPLDNPAQDHWKEVLPEGASVLESAGFIGGKIFASYSIDAILHIKVFSADGKPEGEMPLPQLATGGVSGRWKSNEAFLSYQSFGIPPTVDRYDVANHRLTPWAKQAIPINSESFEAKQVWYNSKDGTRIPMFLFSRKGVELDGSHPALLTGYGGFNAGSSPYFQEEAVVWAEHGGVFALANLRGGNEFGETWHQAGMLGKKQNVFDDFIAAGEYLVANHYTQPQKLAIEGASNGGLLVGAALTQRPDLFGSVVCEYPLLDMVRYQNFLVAKWWVPEYGSSDDPKQFPYLYAYSPYHHIKPGTKYPATLFITGDNDTRVAPLHARKMAARLQAAQGGDKPILLLYDTKSGHSGGRPLSKEIEEKTDVLSFLFWQLEAQKQ
jgi:prolyl oligopeptidase